MVNFKVWVDLFPKYTFEYRISEITSTPKPEIVKVSTNHCFNMIDFIVEVYGIANKKSVD